MAGLRDVLTRNELIEPDGRPVFAYEISQTEWQQLQNDLRGISTKRTHWREEDSATLCVYVAEWWRREFIGGAWRYESPLRGVGLENMNGNAIRRHIDDGMRYLKRTVIQVGGANQYLGTLATEGGLPLNLIRSGGGNLPRAFRRMFRDIGAFGAAQVSTTALGERAVDLMPGVFRQAEGIATTLAGVALIIWELSSVVSANPDKDPIEVLNHENYDWRRRLPLPSDPLCQDS